MDVDLDQLIVSLSTGVILAVGLLLVAVISALVSDSLERQLSKDKKDTDEKDDLG